VSTLFSSVCEMPTTGALASELVEPAECSMSPDDLACESSPCGRDVTCSWKMP
jgi:hypothetical protein